MIATLPTAGFMIATAHPGRGVVFFCSRQVVQRLTGGSATSHLGRWDVAAGNPARRLPMSNLESEEPNGNPNYRTEFTFDLRHQRAVLLPE